MPLISQAASPILGFSFGAQAPCNEAAYVIYNREEPISDWCMVNVPACPQCPGTWGIPAPAGTACGDSYNALKMQAGPAP